MNETNDPVYQEIDVRFMNEGNKQAYVKKVSMDGSEGYGIHATTGQILGLAPSRDVAFAVARQHELEPVSVH